MSRFVLVLLIAGGYLLGRIAWDLLGYLVELIGRMVGVLVASAMKRMVEARQEAAAREAAERKRQRPPIVAETGRQINEDFDATP